jgi:hypothetical protein
MLNLSPCKSEVDPLSARKSNKPLPKAEDHQYLDSMEMDEYSVVQVTDHDFHSV